MDQPADMAKSEDSSDTMEQLGSEYYFTIPSGDSAMTLKISCLFLTLALGHVHAAIAQSKYDEELRSVKPSRHLESLFRTARTKNPRAMELYKQGTYLCRVIAKKEKEERMAEGIKRLQQAVELDPSFSAAHVSLGNAYWDSASLGLLGARDLNGPKAEALLEKARAEYRIAVSLDPANISAHLKVARTTNDHKEALQHYRRVLELDPGQKIPPVARAHIVESKGQVEEAFSILTQGLAGTIEVNRCPSVKGPFSSTEYGLGYFQKKYPQRYKAFVELACIGEGLPAFRHFGE